MASTYLTRTFGSAGTSDKIATISLWCKRAVTGAENSIITAGASLRDFIRFETSGALRVRLSNGASDLTTNRLFRDVSAWYHIVVAFDTTQATSTDRIKIYVNGVQETSFSSTTYPSLNQTLKLGTANPNHIGNDSEQTTPYFDGSMSHFHFTDGTAYQASDFGQYDANGVWTINTSPSVTYGTNGFFILKNSGSVTDQSGNGNNWTVSGGTLTDTLDCSANVFATFNPLGALSTPPTFSNGNTTAAIPNSGGVFRSTLAASSGKWYCEVKANSMNALAIGVQPIDEAYNQGVFSNTSAVVLYSTDGTIYKNGSNIGNIASISDNDIIGMAIDLDNNNIYFSKNGQYASGLSGSWNQTFSNAYAVALNSGNSYTIASQNGGSGTSSNISINFGNGYFGTTAVSSAGTNASGNGIFEYDVPTGYTALCTKGLNGE